jgi:hypothetical protein
VATVNTGTIYWVSETNPLEEDVPGDLETSDRYIEIPHKNDLDLGKQLVLRFTADQLPGHYSTVEEMFRHRGAYQRFKDLLASQGYLEKWYAFEAESTAQALLEWCAENGIETIDNRQTSA